MTKQILIEGEPASVIVKRAKDHGLLWRRDDPKTHPMRLTEEDRGRLVKLGLIRQPIPRTS